MRNRKLVFLLTAALIAASAFGPFVFASPPQGTAYYVDSLSGSDSNDGASKEQPWQSLAKVNDTTFQPGDQILLKAGGEWDGSLWPKGNGTKDAPITVGKYGEGPLPVIRGNRIDTLYPLDDIPEEFSVDFHGMDAAQYNPVVFMGDQSHWIIENLEVTSTADTSTNNVGILLFTTGRLGKTRGLTVRNCYVHGIAAEQVRNVKMTGGILAVGSTTWIDGTPITDYKKQVGFDGLLIEGNYVKDAAKEGVRTTGLGKPFRNKRPHRNVMIRGNYIEEVFGDGIVMSEIVGGVVEYNVVRNYCNADIEANYAGVWAWQSSDVTFRYNEVFGGQYGHWDGEAFDFDTGSIGLIFEYNLSHHNNGGLLLTMPGYEGRRSHSGKRHNIFRYNVSVNDGGGKGQELFHEPPDDLRIYNNTIYAGPSVRTSLFQKGNVGYFKNNIIASAGDNLSLYSIGTITAGGAFRNNIFSHASMAEGLDVRTLGRNAIADPMLADPAAFVALYESGYEIAPPTDGNYEAFLQALRERLACFKIAEGSPAIGGGTGTNTLPAADIFGTKLRGGMPDIGAHQFGQPGRLPVWRYIVHKAQDILDWIAYTIDTKIVFR